MAETELVGRYREVFGLDEATALTEEQVHRHLELERALTHALLDSSPAARWETFERCYNRLYEELPWLAHTGGTADPAIWTALIGAPGARVYEIGSGNGNLAAALARAGYCVTATDVSRERGNRVSQPNLEWASTDGVHLDRFAPASSFDALISNQVIEHLHPDDLDAHLRSALVLLKPGGRYAFATPHALTGPHDVSKVFGLSAPVGMHLREYTNTAMVRALRAAGFGQIRSVLYSPRLTPRPIPSRAHLATMLGLESALGRLGETRGRAMARRLRGPLRLDVFLVAHRPA